MTLYEFTETAEDSELWQWYIHANASEFAFVSGSDYRKRPVLFKPHEDENHNTCSFDEARMYFQFVALSCGHQVDAPNIVLPIYD